MYLIHPLFWGVLGAWMTFKKAEIQKPWNGLSMSETNPLNTKCDLVGTAIAPDSKKPAVKCISRTSLFSTLCPLPFWTCISTLGK